MSTAPGDIADLYHSAGQGFGDQEAIVAHGARLTYAQIDARGERIVRMLRSRGVGPGDIIATLLPDCVAMMELLVATAKLGATILPLNWRLAAVELRYIFDDARPVFLIAAKMFERLAIESTPRCPMLCVREDDADGLQLAFGIDPNSASAPCDPPADRRAPWLLLYTSGTTGRPKGCQHDQRGQRGAAEAMAAWCRFTRDDRLLLTAPLVHVGGLVSLLGIHSAGGAIVIPRGKLDADATLRLVSDEGVTVQSIPVLDPIGYCQAQRRLCLPLALRLMIAGGGMTPVPVLHAIREALGCDMALGYGQTEVGGFASFIDLADQLARPSACGRGLPHLEARIADEKGRDLPAGADGELLLRGPAVMIGYLGQPQDSAAALGGGWLRTGDLFRRDAEGFFHFAGRRKELIKTGGENVYPAEVEAALASHPAVAEACVTGIPDRRYGEAVKACVVLRPGANASPRELADWCRETVAGYKRPRFVEFVSSIPRNFQGKPQRALLSQRAVTADQNAETGGDGKSKEQPP